MAAPKVVLVTGGNSGIGYETVKAFLPSDKAYRVLFGSRFVEKAKFAIEALYREFPESISTVEVVQVDLASDESIERAFEQVKARPGHIDALTNNAGMHTSQYPMRFHAKPKFSRGGANIRHLIHSRQKSPSATASPRSTNVNVAGTQLMTSCTFMPLLLKFGPTRSSTSRRGKRDVPFPTPPPQPGWPQTTRSTSSTYHGIPAALSIMDCY